jgi:hypothetical protein
MQCRISLFICTIAAALSAVSMLVTPAAALEPSLGNPPRIVNVTPDSAPGWWPSEELEQLARKTVNDFLAANDSGDDKKAYSYLAGAERQIDPFARYSEDLRRFNIEAGPVKERKITTITWTKDPAQAPALGIYAAIDLVSRFANIDRHCGYIVLWQPPAGGPFQVMRREDNFLSNETAQALTQQGSTSAVDEAWAQVSAHCPNYGPGSAAGPAPVASGQEPLEEATNSTIGYPTVAAALADLRSKPGVVFTTKDGWTVASDEATTTLWSFSPAGYPAYPAAVKRQFVQENGQLSLKMNVQCEASKAACDDLVRTFQNLNAAMIADMRAHH